MFIEYKKYEEMRSKYTFENPEEIKICFILESPPKTPENSQIIKYIYNDKDIIGQTYYKNIILTLFDKYYQKPDGLEKMKTDGYIILDATYTPIDNLRPEEKKQQVRKDYKRLKQLINRNWKILICGHSNDEIKENLKNEGFNILNKDEFIPLPGYGSGVRFRNLVKKYLF